MQQRQVAETSIHTNLLRDIYATLGEGDADKGWTIRLYWNPLAPWIWLGAGLCALGGFVSLSDRRLRIGAPRRSRPSRRPRNERPRRRWEPRALQCRCMIMHAPLQRRALRAMGVAAMNRALFVLPLLTLAILAGFFGWSLLSGRDPASIGSVMVGRAGADAAAGRWARG